MKNLFAEFRAKAPFNTWWLEIVVDKGERVPNDLAKALADNGWTLAQFQMPDGGIELFKDGNNTVELRTFCYQTIGTGLFGGTTPEESKTSMAKARKVLKQFGLAYGKRRMGWSDCI